MANRRSKRTKIVVGTVIAVVLVVVVAVGLFILTRDEAPEAVDLETAVAQIEAAEAADDRTDTPSTSPSDDDGEDVGTTSSTDNDTQATGSTETDTDTGTATTSTDDTDTETTSAGQTADSLGGLAGVWAVQLAEGAVDLQVEPAVSFAGFRVDEVLSGGIGDFTAVGRTVDVTGSIELTDTALVAATVEVTMSTLRTDNGSRDGQVRRALNTNEFPVATFTLTEPLELPADMAEGEALSGSAHGDLTIKGVTNRATFDLQAQLVGDTIVVVGSSEVVFSNYEVTAPTAPIVVSVEDHGIMEFQLILTR